MKAGIQKLPQPQKKAVVDIASSTVVKPEPIRGPQSDKNDIIIEKQKPDPPIPKTQ